MKTLHEMYTMRCGPSNLLAHNFSWLQYPPHTCSATCCLPCLVWPPPSVFTTSILMRHLTWPSRIRPLHSTPSQSAVSPWCAGPCVGTSLSLNSRVQHQACIISRHTHTHTPVPARWAGPTHGGRAHPAATATSTAVPERAGTPPPPGGAGAAPACGEKRVLTQSLA